MTIQAIVTDIEGTTTSIAFVHETLFPYAARRLPDFLRSNSDEYRDTIAAVREEAGEPQADLERVIGILLEWIEEDRKATPLKALQGEIWREGYRNGAYRGHVYEDAWRALTEWHDRGIALFVYSSGSVQAQMLLFEHSSFGDLTPLFSGHFDTRVGHKRQTESYERIAKDIAFAPDTILFLSDVCEELDAAAAAGMKTIHVVREEGVRRGEHFVVDELGQIEI